MRGVVAYLRRYVSMTVEAVERRAPMFSWGAVVVYLQFVMVPLRGMDDGAGRKAIKKERLPVGGKGCVDKGGSYLCRRLVVVG